MVDSQPAIETFGLGKRYHKNDKLALHNLNITIMPGEVYGFLGPNGAGKSTTIRLLMNFIQPTEGHACILGKNIVTESTQIKHNIGYLPGEIALYPNMTGRQLMDYMTDLLPLKHKNNVSKLAAIFDVPLSKRLNTLSKGNRQKIAIIQAFAAEPEVLILDEPTSGLDPLMQEAFFELIRGVKNKGGTIFFSSHNLTEVQKVCDRAGFIRDGELVAQQTINQLAQSSVQTYDVSFAESVPVSDLKRLKGAKVISNSARHATVKLKGDLKPFFSLLARHKIHALDRREIDLEEEFLSFYKGRK